MIEKGTYNKFPQLAEALHASLSQVVKKTAADIQAAAQQNAPVDTGFLQNSIYTRTAESSGFGDIGAPTKASSYAFPEVDAPPDDTTAYVAVAASYGEYQEYGTRFQPAQPYLTPAVELVRSEFEAALGSIEPTMKGMIGL